MRAIPQLKIIMFVYIDENQYEVLIYMEICDILV